MRALFADVFKKDMSQALWDWKYARPDSAAVGVWRGDELVAHYGGLGNVISYKGLLTTAVQICDVMVDTSVRNAVRRQSPFYLSTSGFIERYVGYHNQWSFGYGFPSDRHMDLAARLKFYVAVGRMWELGWDLSVPPRMPLLLKTIKVQSGNLAEVRATLDTLTSQQCADLGDRVLLRKNAAFIDWRYLRHPHEHYELRLVTHRLTGKAVGLCVLKVEPERILWMDAVAPLSHLPALAQVARVETWRLQRRKLSLWCSAPDVERFGVVGSAQALPITTPANVWTEGVPAEALQGRWWLLAGDTDFL